MSYENDRPTDQCDIADLEIQREIDRGLEAIKNSKRLTSTGKCLYCESEVDEGALFCGKECRDDFEWLNKKRK